MDFVLQATSSWYDKPSPYYNAAPRKSSAFTWPTPCTSVRPFAMLQSDIERCLVELERLWRLDFAAGALAVAYPVLAMERWALAQGIPHDHFNPWYQHARSRLLARLTREYAKAPTPTGSSSNA